VFVVAWLAFSPHTLEWHGVATIGALFVSLMIQRSTHRDTQALHAKVDELILSSKTARDSLTVEDDREPEDIENRRKTPRL
jgi:low affinity Fe/Cu permease